MCPTYLSIFKTKIIVRSVLLLTTMPLYFGSKLFNTFLPRDSVIFRSVSALFVLYYPTQPLSPLISVPCFIYTQVSFNSSFISSYSDAHLFDTLCSVFDTKLRLILRLNILLKICCTFLFELIKSHLGC